MTTSEAPTYAVNRAHVISETIDEEVVIINLETGKYYGLRDAGTQIWQAVEGAASAAEVVDGLCAEYSGTRNQIVADVVAILSRLSQEDLIVGRPHHDEGACAEALLAGPQASGTTPYPPAMLETFTDMQEFLLVDPIHEVDERGFPRPTGREEQAMS